MDAKHTPGSFHRRIGRRGTGTAASQHEQLCNDKGVGVVMLEHDGTEEGNANAQLLAAAGDYWNATEEVMKVATMLMVENARQVPPELRDALLKLADAHCKANHEEEVPS
jgi:hypothetical protein